MSILKWREPNNIGLVLKATGKASEARAMFAEAAAIWRSVLGPDHPETRSSRGVESLSLYQQMTLIS